MQGVGRLAYGELVDGAVLSVWRLTDVGVAAIRRHSSESRYFADGSRLYLARAFVLPAVARSTSS